MVTGGGFNALLKLVEEPPPHLKFVFATTEPEKVIPDHQVADAPLSVPAGPARRAARAPGADPRRRGRAVRACRPADRLQRRGGLCAGRVVRARSADCRARTSRPALRPGHRACSATPTTGCSTRSSSAFSAGDGAAVFHAIDHVVEAGHDTRRFAADLLDRLRDLIVLSAVPDAAPTGLIEAPADRLEQMSAQAAAFGQAALTRAAEIISAGLLEMRGATSPRLLLELMCAQVLLPAGTDNAGLAERLDRLERRLSSATAVPSAPVARPAATRDSPRHISVRRSRRGSRAHRRRNASATAARRRPQHSRRHPRRRGNAPGCISPRPTPRRSEPAGPTCWRPPGQAAGCLDAAQQRQRGVVRRRRAHHGVCQAGRSPRASLPAAPIRT